jgi:hypothetical protein
MVQDQVSKVSTIASVVAVAMLVSAVMSGPSYAQDNTQTAELYQLQAAFHAAATVHDPVNGDSSTAIDQRIRDMLALWTIDGTIVAGGSTYIGTGDPADPTTCPAPSGNPANQGTLCTFFKYQVASFQSANKYVSLSPAYKTAFTIRGNTASFYFECHYFNVAADSTGNPLWTAVKHVDFTGTATKVGGTWLFSQATGGPLGVPVP